MVELGFCKTNNEARRLVDGNAVKIDGTLVTNWKIEFNSGQEFLITSGKRNRNFVRIS
jgi:tyrosyl-tRNA synthetase